jgi:predicted nucleic acid-binding protein
LQAHGETYPQTRWKKNWIVFDTAASQHPHLSYEKDLLDTSVVAGYLLARTRAMQLVRPLLEREEAATNILVYGEVAEYVKKFASFRTYKASLEGLLEQISPYPLTYAILERYADIRRTLRPLHQDIGDIDTLIAATALEENLTLMTIDNDFTRVSNLKWELVNLRS